MDQQQQEEEPYGAPPSQGGNMLGRLWKSHPWQSDETVGGSPKPSLGPAPSASPLNKRRPWSRPWQTEGTADAVEPPLDDIDDVSPSVGPAPSVSPLNKRRPWSRPWQTEGALDAIVVPMADTDDVSLGDASLDDDQQEKVNPPRVVTPPPKENVEPELIVAPVKSDKKKKKKKAKKEKAVVTPPPVEPQPMEQPAPPVEDENTELLAIDFDRDGDALREAIADDVLTMWEEQGLYQDLPELREELLKGVVEQKFKALQEEQAQIIEQRQLEGMPKLATPDPRMSIISEEDEEEDESSDEELNGAAEEPTLEEEEQNMTEDERFALHAFQVQEELEMRLKNLDTTNHVCVESEGRLGKLSEAENFVSIKDHHAFNKFKLHDAVEKRVSNIFTEDHHVVVSSKESSFDEGDAGVMDISSASLPALPSQENEMSFEEIKQRLSTSFSAFDSHLQAKQALVVPPAVSENDDEWTECEVTVAETKAETKTEVKTTTKAENKIDMKKLVADMDRKLGLVACAKAEEDEESFMEYTVRDETVVETVVDETVVDETVVDDDDKEIDVDELSAKREKEKERTKQINQQEALPRIPRKPKKAVGRTISVDSSYIEMTVAEETVDHTRRRPSKNRESMANVTGQSSNVSPIPRTASARSMNGSFPAIYTSELDEDDMTQLTFDHSIEGATSTTQDHHLAAAYLYKNAGGGSPKRPGSKYGSAADSQQTENTHTTTPMDESSYSQDKGSMGSMSKDSSSAMSKSVAKILRVEIWSTKVRVVQSAMDRLAKAAGHGASQRANITRLGGVIAILRAMQTHSVHLEIQRSACAALCHLSVDDDSQVAISEVGGTAAIVSAMESHPDDRQVQESACSALANITCPRSEAASGSDSEDDEDSPSRDRGVVEALVMAMSKHPQSTEVQAKAFGALANLCLDNPARLQELSQSGGLTAMTLALQKPWKNKMDQHEAISTLSILLRSLAEVQC